MVDRRRQWRAENQQISIKKKIESGKYIVKGTQGDEYFVDINKPFCACPDWEKRKPNGGCKHILKAKIKTGDVSNLPNQKTNAGSYLNKTEYPDNWRKLSKQTKKRDGWKCQKCYNKGGKYGNAELHAHHIVPKSKGGDDKLSNLITLCVECHEDQHGHPIGFNQSNSDYGSSNDNSKQHTAGQTMSSKSNRNSESADMTNNNQKQYYNVEPGLHTNISRSKIPNNIPSQTPEIEKTNGEPDWEWYEANRTESKRSKGSGETTREKTESDRDNKNEDDTNIGEVLIGLAILIIIFLFISAGLIFVLFI